jgi:hypothetical protein
VQKISALAGSTRWLAEAPLKSVRGDIETVRDPVHIGVIGVCNLSSLIPAVIVHVNPEWIAVRAELVDEPSVVIESEVDPSVRASDIRVEPQKPGGMRGGAGAVYKTPTQVSYEPYHGAETGPRFWSAARGKLIRLDIDAPNRWNRVHVPNSIRLTTHPQCLLAKRCGSIARLARHLRLSRVATIWRRTIGQQPAATEHKDVPTAHQAGEQID